MKRPKIEDYGIHTFYYAELEAYCDWLGGEMRLLGEHCYECEQDYVTLEKENALLDSSNRLKRQDVINKEQQIKELKESIQDYAKFCIECDRQGMKPLDYDGYLKLEYKNE